MTLRTGEVILIWRRRLWIALCGGIVLEVALNLSSDRILNEWMQSWTVVIRWYWILWLIKLEPLVLTGNKAREMYRGNGDRATQILNPDTTCRWSALHPGRFTPKKRPPIPTDVRLDGFQSQNLRCGGKLTNPRIWSSINILRDALKVNRKISLGIRMDARSDVC